MCVCITELAYPERKKIRQGGSISECHACCCKQQLITQNITVTGENKPLLFLPEPQKTPHADADGSVCVHDAMKTTGRVSGTQDMAAAPAAGGQSVAPPSLDTGSRPAYLIT